MKKSLTPCAEIVYNGVSAGYLPQHPMNIFFVEETMSNSNTQREIFALEVAILLGYVALLIWLL